MNGTPARGDSALERRKTPLIQERQRIAEPRLRLVKSPSASAVSWGRFKEFEGFSFLRGFLVDGLCRPAFRVVCL
jgi:hypothetical protein